jgi:hypothetical protein
MVSAETVRGIFRVLSRHLTFEQIENLLRELLNVKGNKSFRDTVKALEAECRYQASQTR